MSEQERDNLEFELSQYLDGQLSGRRERRLERRLEQDPALREELKKYASLEGGLASLAQRELAGLDYDAQRGEVVRMLERKRLLAAPRRAVIFRPVFAWGGGALAVAAGLLVGMWAWMSSGTGTVPARQPSPATVVSVALVAPSAGAKQERAEVTLRKLSEDDFRLQDVAADTASVDSASADSSAEGGATELAVGGRRPPPGTIMMYVHPSRPPKWGRGSVPFPAEF
jgi:anti-sigma factor RsiW